MKIDGGCLCGGVTYKAEIDPDKVAICHCTDCQTLSGSAFRISVPTDEEFFEIASGEPKIYVKTAESGAKRVQAFCPQCGTHIYTTSVGDGPKMYRIRVATARQRNDLPPKAQIWFRSAQPWVTELGSVRSVEKQQ
ncbi:MAG: GFA family protein [Proteobacteria bacterium]|nr:GFA family protein [Pseudomonadota bacterium]